MGKEVDLLANYPKANRNVKARGLEKTEKDREIARKFGKEFFDGDRSHGYGGFSYNPKFWSPVVPTLKEHFSLSSNTSLLDVGCAKGFMLNDIAKAIEGISLKGIDISEYAIANSIEGMRQNLVVANAKDLPFDNNSFDVVISINTVHNLEKDELAQALQEIERVSKDKSFITVDAYNSEDEKERMYAWNLTAKTIMSVDEWVSFFNDVGYTGDYYWFIP
jgi:SAM-dependent methyltransferase